MGKQPDPRAPRDVTMSSTGWCLPPSQGFHVPAACTAPQMCCQPREQCGEGVCDIHVISMWCCRTQGWEQGGLCSSEPPDPPPSALLLAAMARLSRTPRALASTNSSVLSSLSSTNDALLTSKDYSSCSSTTIKALQLRTGLAEAGLLQGGKEALAMKALSSLGATGTVIRLICAGSTVGALFLRHHQQSRESSHRPSGAE